MQPHSLDVVDRSAPAVYHNQPSGVVCHPPPPCPYQRTAVRDTNSVPNVFSSIFFGGVSTNVARTFVHNAIHRVPQLMTEAAAAGGALNDMPEVSMEFAHIFALVGGYQKPGDVYKDILNDVMFLYLPA